MGVKASHIALIAIFVLVHNALAIVERPAATSVPGISTSEMPQFVLFTVSDRKARIMR